MQLKNRITIVLLVVLFPLCSFSQNYTLSGYVIDSQTGEPLPFVSCYDAVSRRVCVSNQYGFYTLAIPSGKVEFRVSYMGYKESMSDFTLNSDTMLNILLTPASIELEEVSVKSTIPRYLQSSMGKMNIPIKNITALPSFIGEPDIMKSISFLPGVASGRDGYSNVYVRGGDRGQNLILLDGMKLYNTNHLGGLISLFNSNIIKHVDVYKGGFPSRYGGRASSVIDVYTKDGNRNEYKGKLNVGLLNSGIVYEGPITDKSSFIVAGRTAYYDLFTIPSRINYYKNKNSDFGGSAEFVGYSCFDVNAKLTYNFTQLHKIWLSFIMAHDIQTMAENHRYTEEISEQFNKLKTHNTGVSLGESYIINSKLFMKNSLSYTNYTNKISISEKISNKKESFVTEQSTETSINDFTLQSRFEYTPNSSNTIKWGLESTFYNFTPSLKRSFNENDNTGYAMDTVIGYTKPVNSFENNLYFEWEFNAFNRIWLNVGGRGTAYFCKDTTYYRVEPRTSLMFLIFDPLSFKANYTILNQFNHVVVNNYSFFEREIWMAATKKLKPQSSQQVSAGFFYNLPKPDLEFSLEAYYKKMYNQLEYKMPVRDEGNNSNLEDLVYINGKGEAYGFEFQLEKKEGKFIGSLNYTLSWNFRQFDELNFGEQYPFIYDRRHSFSILGAYSINQKYKISSNFVFSTGTPFTMPEAFIKEDDFSFGYYGYEGINNYRLPNYHRLDLSFTRTGKTKKNKGVQFDVNIFNVYARKNPVYIFYNQTDGKVYSKSMFSIIPSVSFSMEL